MVFPIAPRVRGTLLASCLWGWVAMAAPQARYGVAEEAAGPAGSSRVIVIRGHIAGIQAAVSPSEGGELTSLRVKVRGAWIELVYRAREYAAVSGFRGKASFLWPAVRGQYLAGSNPADSCADGTYLLGDRSYPTPCHGFAKRLVWEETGHSADQA